MINFINLNLQINYVSSTPSGSDYFDTKNSFGHRATSSGVSGSLKPQVGSSIFVEVL